MFRNFKVIEAFQGLKLLQVCLVHRMVYHFTENFKLLAVIIIRKQSQIIQIIENSLLQPEFENIFESIIYQQLLFAWLIIVRLCIILYPDSTV